MLYTNTVSLLIVHYTTLNLAMLTVDTQVDIQDIDEVRLGQTTSVFQKHKAPELSKSSFSVMYHHHGKSLDVIAKDPNEFRIWVSGIRELIRLTKNGTNIRDLKTLVLDLPLKGKARNNDGTFANINQNTATKALT